MTTVTKLYVIAVLLLGFPLLMVGQSDAYEFPVTAESEKWKQFTTHQQMMDVLQIPREVLEKMSTEGLLETCMNYPMAMDMMAYNTLQHGIEAIIKDFNGLAELQRRKNSAGLLLKLYSKIEPGQYHLNWPLVKKGQFAFKITYIELLLAQDKMLSQLDKQGRKQLLKKALRNFEIKLEHPKLYGLQSINPPTLIMGRILAKDNAESFNRRLKENDKLSRYLQTSQIDETYIFDEIVAEARAYLSEQ